MARTRNLKPGFFDNEILHGECGPYAAILYEGLWCNSDREGRLEDRPLRIKAKILPYYHDQDVDVLLSLLQLNGFILRYQIEGNKYIQILSFLKHQNPHVKETESTIPAPTKVSASNVNSNTSMGNSGDDRASSLDPLIPDPLIPSSTLSGKPDVAPPESKKTKPREAAREIIAFLNELTDRNYQGKEPQLKLIMARMQQGYPPLVIRKVIIQQVKKWKGDPKMDEFLRPKTLFNDTNFSEYAGTLKNLNELMKSDE